MRISTGRGGKNKYPMNSINRGGYRGGLGVRDQRAGQPVEQKRLLFWQGEMMVEVNKV